MDRREARRLAVIERQALLARIGRRNALASLSAALADEDASSALASRSRGMAEDYAWSGDMREGATLAERARFASALSGIAREAERARDDAARQAEWQAQALAASEQRMKRLQEHEVTARRAVEAAREKRDMVEAGALARKLQGRPRSASARQTRSGDERTPERKGIE